MSTTVKTDLRLNLLDAQGRIADLQRQLAEAKTEIEAMRPIVDAALEFHRTRTYFDVRSAIKFSAACREYEEKQP